MRFKTKLFGIDLNFISLSSLDPRNIDVGRAGAALATGGGSEIYRAVTGEPISKTAGDVVDIVTGEKSRQAQTDAQNKGLAAEKDAINKQIDLINDNKKESKKLIDDLEVFLNANDINIETTLLTANDESSRILLASVLAAFNTSLFGIHDYADQLLKTAKNVSEELKKGNNDVARELKNTALEVYNTNIDAVGATQRRETAAVTDAATTLESGVERSSLAELTSLNKASTASQAETDEITETFTPWIESGVWATQELQDNYEELTRSFTIDDFQKEGGYDLRLNQALDTITNRASALGVTGGTSKDLVEYSQDFASLEYGKAYDRFNLDQADKIGYLAGLSDTGLRASETVGGYKERESGRQTGFELGRGDIESGRITSIADIVAQKELRLGEIDARAIESGRLSDVGRDAAFGEIEAGRLGEESRIKTAYAGDRGRFSSDLIASEADLRTKLALTQGNIESGQTLREGQVSANILERGGTTATNLANMRMANQNQTSANLINAEGAIGSSLSSYYTNIGDIEANYYQNFNNMLNTLVNTGVAAYGAGVFSGNTAGSTVKPKVSNPSLTVAGSQNFLTNPDNFNFTNP